MTDDRDNDRNNQEKVGWIVSWKASSYNYFCLRLESTFNTQSAFSVYYSVPVVFSLWSTFYTDYRLDSQLHIAHPVAAVQIWD